MLDENGKFVILNKEWKDAINAMPEQERLDKILKMASEFAVQEGIKYAEALAKALEEKNDSQL
jgi:hypothetical protein